VWSASITVLNPGFEDNVLSDGSSGPVPASWSGGGIAWNPTTTQYPGEAPEGQNVAAINIGNLWQAITGSSITAGLTYILEVDVGYRLDVATTPNYTVELRASGPSGTLLVSKDQSDVTPSKSVFSTLTLSFTAPTGAAYLGQTLAIKMTSAGVQTNFDNVRLSAVPLPAALPLFSGGLALLGWRRPSDTARVVPLPAISSCAHTVAPGLSGRSPARRSSL